MKLFRKILLGLITGFIITTQCVLTVTKAEETHAIEEITLDETIAVSFSGTEERIVYSFTPEKTDVYYLLPEKVDDNYESVLIQVSTDPYDQDSVFSWLNVYYSSIVEDYLAYNGGHTLRLEKGKTYYFEMTAWEPESTYQISLSLHERPFSIDSLTVENPTYYRGADDTCGVFARGEGEIYYMDYADSILGPSITAVLDGKEYSGKTSDVRDRIYDDYGYFPYLVEIEDYDGHYYVKFDEREVEFSVNILAPIESVSIDDYVLIYSETTLNNCKMDWYIGDSGPITYYSYGGGIYGDPTLTVTAEGNVYRGTLADVREQLYEVYGAWFNLHVLPVKERFEVGTTGLECYFGGIQTTMNVVLRDDITEIDAPVVKMVFRIYKDPAVAPGVQLSWNPVDIGARATIRYYVYRAEEGITVASKRTPYTWIGSTYKTTFTDNSIEEGKYYYYKVMTVCLETEMFSASSNVVSYRPIFKTERPVKKINSLPVRELSGITLAK